jgi:hypothetical protein
MKPGNETMPPIGLKSGFWLIFVTAFSNSQFLSAPQILEL